MRKDYLEFCDLLARNTTGETIPGFAAMQVAGYFYDFDGNVAFKVKKPDGSGKLYLINSPFDIAPGQTGDATNHHGAFVLYSGELPSFDGGALYEWGPKAGSWAIDASGKGFILCGQPEGEPASLPGFPPTASTQRVRVAMVTSAAKPPNRIQGTVAQSTTPATLQFPVQNVFVLSGVDPRPEPHSPAQAVIIQNNLQQAYQNGVDRITATQNESDGLWYVETPTGEGSKVIPFELTGHKVYSAADALAKPLKIDGTVDAQAPAFYVIDRKNRFYGRAPENGERGFIGTALLVNEQYKEGLPGYQILEMEGPALRMIVKLAGSYTSGGTSCTVQPQKIWGHPTMNRRLPPTGSVVVEDPLHLATLAQQNDLWEVSWEQSSEKYIFINPLSLTGFITVKGTAATVTRETEVITLGNLKAVNGPLPPYSTIAVKNSPPINAPGGEEIFARYNLTAGDTLQNRWDTGDAGNFLWLDRGLDGWSGGERQGRGHEAGGDPIWIPTAPCEAP